jgi:hypothetical protein
MIELEASDLHFLEPDPGFDKCVHGSVSLKIDGKVVAQSEDSESTVSGSALQLLRSLEKGHRSNEDSGSQLIPHCAIPDLDEEDRLWLTYCDYGVDWDIEKLGNDFIHRFADGTSTLTNGEEWVRATINLATAVLEFIDTNPERQYEVGELPYEKQAFELYCTELRTLIKKYQ